MTALGPVIVAHSDALSFPSIARRLATTGHTARLPWLLDSVRGTLDEDAGVGSQRRSSLRAKTLLDLFLQRADALAVQEDTLDVLDRDIRSLRSAQAALAEASPRAQRWRIATRIRDEDFLSALRAARDAS
ncbi:MAG: hypothetical protein AAF447_07770 [Myxococcota bacterium]